MYSTAGNHQAALADFRKSAELDPKDPDAQNNIGIELSYLKGGDEELKAYDGDALGAKADATAADRLDGS